MEWIVQILREASLTRGNMVKRWKKKDGFSEFFCSRNYNKYGCYISLINVKDRRREVIIIPELNFNSRWLSFAEKVGKFINSRKLMNGAITQYGGETFHMLQGEQIRGWSNRLWKQTHSLNIYEMGNDFFLFEFALKVIAEQVFSKHIFGHFWGRFRNNPVILQWWNPTIGMRCGRSKENSTWVKIVGLPLHFWDQKIFKVIGDFYGV
ncbi:hypothetical protein H5410_043700 [Solanum commersonii]|uniref:DUF4283 domain-containing protein n=1 Tax=Solanum commersonii TaxID=4109 RepID=A0A9J5XZL3_SOLCO|nr:hypothetical protein H5410_043700 [Solanum commersonii]